MATEYISPNIKAALKANLEHKAPASLLANIMKQVSTPQTVVVVPQTNYTLLAIGLLIAIGCIALPFIISPNAVLQTSFSLPKIQISPMIWMSAIAIMLLYAADQFLSSRQLKHIMHR